MLLVTFLAEYIPFGSAEFRWAEQSITAVVYENCYKLTLQPLKIFTCHFNKRPKLNYISCTGQKEIEENILTTYFKHVYFKGKVLCLLLKILILERWGRISYNVYCVLIRALLAVSHINFVYKYVIPMNNVFLSIFVGYKPSVPIGTTVIYRCPDEHYFPNKFNNDPFVLMTCMLNGQFDAPEIWPNCRHSKLLIHLADPQSGSDNRLPKDYGLPFQNRTKQNNLEVKMMIATGEFVGLAEGIINETYLLYLCLASNYINCWSIFYNLWYEVYRDNIKILYVMCHLHMTLASLIITNNGLTFSLVVDLIVSSANPDDDKSNVSKCKYMLLIITYDIRKVVLNDLCCRFNHLIFSCMLL